MAQELRIITWCDNVTKHADADVPAEPLPPITVSRDGGRKPKPRQIDLCGECRAELYDPLIKLLDAEGRDPDSGRKRPGPKPTSTAKQTQPLPEQNSPDSRLEYLPEADRDPNRNAAFDCPTCGYNFPKGGTSLSMHRVRKHGYRKGDDD